MTSLSRGRLLAGAALGVGLAFLPQQAMAACTVSSVGTGAEILCDVDTTTTNTTYVGGATSSDREFQFSVSPLLTQVDPGITVDGYGLALTDLDGDNTLTVVNDGTIQVDAGNVPTAGGTAALNVTLLGSSTLDYSGTGDIANLGTGAGLEIRAVDGSVTGNTSGDITAVTGRGLDVQTSGTGSIDFTSAGLISSDTVNGVWAEVLSGTGGDLTLDLNDATAGTGFYAVWAPSASDTGNVDVTTNGTLTGGGGISTGLSSGTATGDVMVASNGDIIADDIGITAFNSGSGDVTVTSVGPIAATSAYGIDATANGGNVTVDAGAITAGTYGISATQTNAAGTGDIDVGVTGAIAGATDGILASNAGLGGVIVTTGPGAVTAAAGSAIVAENTNAASTDPILVTVGAGGATGTGADAVIASTAGTGTVTVNSAGPVVSDTGNGITTSATTGATVVNVTGGSVTGGIDGINATGTTGPITVVLTGAADVTGVDDAISVDSSGAKVVNIGTGSVVSGAYGVNGFGGGTLTVANAGTLGTAGQVAVLTDLATAANITNQTGGVMNGRVDLSDSNDTVTNAGTWNLAGAQNFYLGTDTITNQAGGTITVAAGSSFNGLETLSNAGTLTAASGLVFDAGNTAVTNTGTMNVAGTLDFGGGTDSLANNGTGIFNLTGATTLAGLETLTNSGRINLNTFTLTGPAIAFNNTGTIDTNGSAGIAGFTTFSNAGTLDLAAGTFTVPAAVFTNTGTILADEGATTITGQTSFANSGTLDLQDGAVGDVLTINSAFVGSGGSTLAIDFADATADELVITGAASGTTSVDAQYVGLGLINLDGVQVVDAASATAGAFVLGDVTGNVSPLVDYSLVQNGGDFFLVSAPTQAVFDPLVVPAFATSLWYQSADEVLAETRKPATTVGASFWGDVYWSRDKFGDNDDTVTVAGVPFDVDTRLETKRLGFQLGVDYGFNGARVGLTGGWGRAKADDDSDLTDVGLKAKGWNVGLYGQFGGITGFHGEALIKYDKYNGDFNNGAFDGVDFDIKELGFDGGLGYRFGIGGDANVDIAAGVSHVRTKVDDFDAFGFGYDIGKLTSTRGRLGARAVFGGSLAPYVDATVYHEFNGDGDVELFDGATVYDLDTTNKGTWVRLEGGLSGNDGPGPILALWGDIGDKKGFGLRAGWRLGGRMAEAVLPPPPPPAVAPPPPPPPATQTCPDGSVILATDACPPPPPPPPPPPMPERG